MEERILQLNDTGEDVKKVQNILKELKYSIKELSGHFDMKMKIAVIGFQNDFRINSTGIVDKKTWEKLNSLNPKIEIPEIEEKIENLEVAETRNRPVIRRGSMGASVKELQLKLKALRFLEGEADGIFGALTQSSVVNFQNANGLVADGIVGPMTWAALDQAFSAVERPESIQRPTIRMGSRGEEVVLLQTKLRALGFFFGQIDGIFGPNTEAAVENFQTTHNLVPDGIVGPITWERLEEIIVPGHPEYAVLKEGTTGEDVRILQNKLKLLGYFPGSITGSFGPETKAAVIEFQTNNGLVADGIVGPMTWDKLFELTTPPTPPMGGIRPTLRLGDTGEYVKELQKELTTLMYYTGPLNGIFDELTNIAVKSFQAVNKLTPDGIVGKSTWFALDSIYSELASCN